MNGIDGLGITISIFTSLLIIIATYILSRLLNRYFKRRAALDKDRAAIFILVFRLTKWLLYSIALISLLAFVLTPLGLIPNPIDAFVRFLEDQSHFIVLAVGVAIAGWISLKFLGLVFDGIKSSGKINARMVGIIRTGVNLLIYSIVGLILIQVMFSMVGLKEIAGSVVTLFATLIGIAVSFAASGSLGNFLAGMLLMSWQPFKINDRIEVGGGVYGDLLEFTLTYVKIRTIKDEMVIVPNLQVISNKIMNYSGMPSVILHTDVTLGYDINRKIAEDTLLEAAEGTPLVMKDRKPFVLINSLDQYYVTYQLNAYTDRPNQMVDIYSQLHKNILDAFNKKGIKIVSPLIIDRKE